MENVSMMLVVASKDWQRIDSAGSCCFHGGSGEKDVVLFMIWSVKDS